MNPRRWTSLLSLRLSLAGLMVVVVVLALRMPIFSDYYHDGFPAPGFVLRQVPGRIKNLRPGMTEQQVWKTLGLAGYRRGPIHVRGPYFDYETSYPLGSGYSMSMSSDWSRNPHRFTHCEFRGPTGFLAATTRPVLYPPPLTPEQMKKITELYEEHRKQTAAQ